MPALRASDNTRPIFQGDVALIPVRTIPIGAQVVPNSGERIILAYGERTGHHHSLSAHGAVLFRDSPPGHNPDDAKRYLRVEKDARLVHQEHGAIELPAGSMYEVRMQAEASWPDDRPRPVFTHD